jgi:4-hydroxy-3-polyprenylbenzoate decarboxylase
MATATEAGAVVMPASPAFWHRPETVDDLVSSLVERIMVHLGALENPSIEWTGN